MKIYTCKCGKEFSKKQAYCGHCSHCSIKQGHEIKDRIGNARSHKGKKVKRKLKPIEDRLKLGIRCSTSHLKSRLIKEGLKERKCERCNLTEWLGEKIPLELHHINGNKKDNRLENLMLLCPNCHAFTDNYRGKNIK